MKQIKRPILIVAIGYIIGIIEGLYFKISVVPLYVCIATIIITIKVIKIQNKSINKIIRYKRYIKLYVPISAIILFMFSSIISQIITTNINQTYVKCQTKLNNESNIILTGEIVSKIEEKEYETTYTIKIEKTNINEKRLIGKKIIIHQKDKNTKVDCGDKLSITGTFEMPEGQRNYGGYDYNLYLKTKKIIGTIKANKIQIIQKYTEITPAIFMDIKLCAIKSAKFIQERTFEILPKNVASIFTGLILGNTDYIEEGVIQSFRNANMSHILAISGLHMTYLIIISMYIFKKLVGKQKAYIITILVIIFYMFLTGFSASIVRAGIMGIILILSKLIHRNNDTLTNISIAILGILIYNPFTILNIGFQLSFGGTIGIVLFQKNISKIFEFIEKNNKRKLQNQKLKKIKEKVTEIITVTLSAQIVILPISIYHFNTFSPYFLITNLLIGFLIEPIMLCNFLFLILICISIKVAKIFSIIPEIGMKILLTISQIGKIPKASIYLATPSFFKIITYFVSIIILFFLFNIYIPKNKNTTTTRFKNNKALLKFYIRNRMPNKYKKIIKYALISILLIILLNPIIPKDLKIHFVDVNQGDCTFIETPKGKTILIDGGGSSNYDIGKNTLLPYILDRGYTKIDIVIISHFDTDHVGGLLTILKELKVKQVIIGEQFENNDNLKKFNEIIKNKNIKVTVVKQENEIHIEKDLSFGVLWPDTDNIIKDNLINNNALVLKLKYDNFSMLFTGDIEKETEEALIQKYKNTENLKSEILKVAHHGSKSSTTEEFLELVNPKIALIGVGKNNLYGHPSNQIIERLEKLDTKIFRTDLDREIEIAINRKGLITINKLQSD